MNTRFCPNCRRSFGSLERCPVDGARLRALPEAFPDAGAVIDGEYRLLAPIAQGGMSRVYRAVALQTSEPLAVKVLDPRLAAHLYTLTRFYREARVSALLDHPNVVKVHGYGPTATGHHAIALELLGGESLGSVLRRLGTIEWERAVHIAIELCDALGHTHGRRVVHRDLKPENIQLTGEPGKDERVKLMDFGIAYVAFDRTFLGPAPGSTNISGTPAYMSPEQIRGEPLDGRSDLYALGILLFEMLSGHRPFASKDPVELCRMQLGQKPPALEGAVFRGAPPPTALFTVTRELLAKSRQSRLPAVGALLERLLAILPQERWPTRFSRHLGQRTRFRSESGIRRLITTDVPASAGARVVLLQVGIESARVESHRATSWSQPIDTVLAEWRAVLEGAGALVQQPEPDSLRVLFGVYQPLRIEHDITEALRATVSLRQRLGQHTSATGEAVSFRAAVLLGEATGQEEGGQGWVGDGIRGEHALLARALLRATPAGRLALSGEVREALGSRPANYQPFGPVTAGPGIVLPEAFLLSFE